LSIELAVKPVAATLGDEVLRILAYGTLGGRERAAKIAPVLAQHGVERVDARGGGVVESLAVDGGELQSPRPNAPGAERRAERQVRRQGSRWQALGDNPGGAAGGGYLGSLFGDIEVIRSTISGNSAPIAGGLYALTYDGSITVDSSTISGNNADSFGGGAVLVAKYLQVLNSTISGNTSEDTAGGLVINSEYDDARAAERGGARRDLVIEFTTITGNSANDIGGLALSVGISIPITASMVSGNTAATDPDIGFNPDSFAQADLEFSLVGVDSTSGTLIFDTTSSTLLGQDPLLGPLADNGGPTFTHLPGDGSPLINAVPSGSAGCGSTAVDDQGGQSRPVDGACDIGSVERGSSAPPPPAVAVPVMDRIGLLLMAGLLGLAGLFGFRRRSERKS